MNHNAWLRAGGLLAGLLLAGCDGAKLCKQCERPPKTVRVEVDWQQLAEALQAAQSGDTTTVRIDSFNVSSRPDRPDGPNGSPQPKQTVTVAGWENLVAAMNAIGNRAQVECADCTGAGTTPEITTTNNNYNTTFTFRFAPPWFNADQRSLFTSYVVFPEEAKFKEWIHDESGEGCPRKDGRMPSSVCPDTAFYKKALAPFLQGLSRCATAKRVELSTVGFASSTGVSTNSGELQRRYEEHIGAVTAKPGDCRGERDLKEAGELSDMFNLLIANERAVNVAAMLRTLVPNEPKDAFDIKAIPWCSHASMAAERPFDDGGDATKGLLNRRVEVRLMALPGCLNVDPDLRMDVAN